MTVSSRRLTAPKKKRNVDFVLFIGLVSLHCLQNGLFVIDDALPCRFPQNNPFVQTLSRIPPVIAFNHYESLVECGSKIYDVFRQGFYVFEAEKWVFKESINFSDDVLF